MSTVVGGRCTVASGVDLECCGFILWFSRPKSVSDVHMCAVRCACGLRSNCGATRRRGGPVRAQSSPVRALCHCCKTLPTLLTVHSTGSRYRMYTPHTNAHAFAYDTVRVAHHHLSVYCTEYMNMKMNLSCSSRVHSVTSHNFTLQSMRGVEGGGGFGTLHGASSVAASFRASAPFPSSRAPAFSEVPLEQRCRASPEKLGTRAHP
jgi:hypothetical protein